MKKQAKSNLNQKVMSKQSTVLKHLASNTEGSPVQISLSTKINVSDVMSILSDLEQKDIVSKCKPGQYIYKYKLK